ncbi:SDR family oxidoreductase [Leuconostoc rapi]|uniref:SDR family oxidoreductase n=1 Tax=Leuconostoc rapi TaxID=1406906 RepID=UPI001959FA63|nr:SDR family oxidoreductase [Leuconostoc rapi]MBM7435056.1 NAD(P)-dependent dehydrogenase (short-subunit alcohol dehydrogenase family) [Leuconostoc rapi]
MTDTNEQYKINHFPKQSQAEPGLQSRMSPTPDDGAADYVGHERLKYKKALITGGDSGIGRAVAIAYAHEGADIVLNYLPEEESDAQEVKGIVESLGQHIKLVPGDLKSEIFSQALVDEAVAFLGDISILVLVAGKQQAVVDIAELSTTQLIDTYTTNVFSAIWLIKAALPHLQPGSSIITTNSIQADQPAPFLVDYAGTKAALKNMTISLAKQFANRGIRVNSVAPGPIWTPLQIVGGQLPENIPTFGQSTPLKRAGQPAELAGAYVFLASDETSYITGESIKVTGGL